MHGCIQALVLKIDTDSLDFNQLLHTRAVHESVRFLYQLFYESSSEDLLDLFQRWSLLNITFEALRNHWCPHLLKLQRLVIPIVRPRHTQSDYEVYHYSKAKDVRLTRVICRKLLNLKSLVPNCSTVRLDYSTIDFSRTT